MKADGKGMTRRPKNSKKSISIDRYWLFELIANIENGHFWTYSVELGIKRKLMKKGSLRCNVFFNNQLIDSINRSDRKIEISHSSSQTGRVGYQTKAYEKVSLTVMFVFQKSISVDWFSRSKRSQISKIVILRKYARVGYQTKAYYKLNADRMVNVIFRNFIMSIASIYRNSRKYQKLLDWNL